jgi:hypothetical protein
VYVFENNIPDVPRFQELYFTGHRHFLAIHTQLVIDNVSYIYYAEARILGHQNNAKQFEKARLRRPFSRVSRRIHIFI